MRLEQVAGARRAIIHVADPHQASVGSHSIGVIDQSVGARTERGAAADRLLPGGRYGFTFRKGGEEAFPLPILRLRSHTFAGE